MPELIAERLKSLRDGLSTEKLSGFVIPHTDEFGSEYLPENAERLAWMTGFTGSSGAAIVTADKAMVMTDGRYTIQIKNQVDKKLFEICDMADITLGDWIGANAKKGDVFGYDPKLHTKKQIDGLNEKLTAAGISLRPVGNNPIDKIWADRPQSPIGIVEIFPDDIAGATSAEKRSSIAATLKKDKISSVIISLADSLCWLLNIRGSDIGYNPLVLSYAVLHNTGKLDWYVDAQKIPETVRVALGEGVAIHPFGNFAEEIKNLKGAVQFDDTRSSIWIYSLLVDAGLDVVGGKDPCILPKAIKTPEEQLSIRQVHIRDGVALVRFLFWLEAQDVSSGHLTELTIEEKLEEFRRADKTYRGKSFDTIAGWADHGAIIHYRATKDSNAVIKGNSFLLLDSGGQYEYGTTDITRTIVIGNVTAEMKDRYTRVLKGHIALASAKFAEGTEGVALDNLARQPLIDEGLNFAHGTGHGVGCFLCVHEEAASISPRGKDAMRAGMLVSNEPGYYKEGAYGIRHENLILCREDDNSGQLYFDTITVVPFDTRGIDWDLMTDAETEWLNNYHAHVFETLKPFLGEMELAWLERIVFPQDEHPISAENFSA